MRCFVPSCALKRCANLLKVRCEAVSQRGGRRFEPAQLHRYNQQLRLEFGEQLGRPVGTIRREPDPGTPNQQLDPARLPNQINELARGWNDVDPESNLANEEVSGSVFLSSTESEPPRLELDEFMVHCPTATVTYSRRFGILQLQ